MGWKKLTHRARYGVGYKRKWTHRSKHGAGSKRKLTYRVGCPPPPKKKKNQQKTKPHRMAIAINQCRPKWLTSCFIVFSHRTTEETSELLLNKQTDKLAGGTSPIDSRHKFTDAKSSRFTALQLHLFIRRWYYKNDSVTRKEIWNKRRKYFRAKIVTFPAL